MKTPQRFAAVFGNLANYSADGAIQFICMDWRHIGEVVTTSQETYSEQKTGRHGYGIELDPHHCDVTIQRLADAFKVEAIFAATGKPFND